MNKQKKQLLLLLFVLLLAVGAFLLVSRIPGEDEAEEAESYSVTNLDAENVCKLSFMNENGTFTLTKQGDSWVYEGDKALDMDEDAVDNLVNKVAALTSENCMEQVEDASIYGLDEPIVTILVSDGTTSYTLLVGDYNDMTYTYYLCLEDDKGTVYTTTSYNVSSFMDGIDNLIAEEEETESEMQVSSEEIQE